MEYKNLKLIGTSHIATQSIKKVRKAIEEDQPAVVAIELDPKRMQSLLQPAAKGPRFKGIRQVGFKGWLFALIGSWISRKLGARVGVMPGSDMLEAYKIAKKHKIPVYLVDRDIEVTLRRFSKQFTWKEKWRILIDILKSFFQSKKKINLAEVPAEEIIEQMLGQVKERYPTIYKVIVEERNHHMARNLVRLMKKHESVIAVVGAGHLKELKRLVKEYYNKLEIV